MIGWDFFIALVARLWYNGFKGDNGMIYYGMITAAVAMFSIQFFFKNIYRNARGSGTGATLEFFRAEQSRRDGGAVHHERTAFRIHRVFASDGGTVGGEFNKLHVLQSARHSEK